jgi:hypothetical protein
MCATDTFLRLTNLLFKRFSKPSWRISVAPLSRGLYAIDMAVAVAVEH